MPHYGPEVTRKVFEFLGAGKSQGEVQRLTGVSQPTISRWVKDRRLNGNQPTDDGPIETTALAIPTPAHPDALQRISALPAHHNALPAHCIASERTEPPTWVNRGTHFAADMVDWIDAYAREYRIEKREVLDLALRTLRAIVDGEGVRRDA